MRNKLLFIPLTIIIFLFPSICFSESKTVVGEDCQIYLGDMKDKKELGKIRQSVREESIKRGLVRLLDLRGDDRDDFEDCFPEIIRKIVSHQYLEKVVVISHTEKGRKICDKVKITTDPEVIDKYLVQEGCRHRVIFLDVRNTWYDDIDEVLTKKDDKIINIGLIIEVKIFGFDEHKKELFDNEDEQQFFDMTERNKDKYKVIDRRHLTKILEEQKLSSSGITDSETVKLGKILNLDIIVLRMIYEGSQVTKVLKVDTGEVLLFKTYKTE